MPGGRGTRARLPAVTALSAITLLTAACSSSPPRQPDPPDVVVKASDTACTAAATTFDPGPLTFSISNSGSHPAGVAVYGAGDRVIGEVDDIGPSASKRLTLSLKAGAYDIVCGSTGSSTSIRTPIVVKAPSGSPPTTSPAQNRAVADYRHYVQEQAELLVAKLGPFTDAVRAGDIQLARALYPAARQPYQRIEPVVQAMGDLASSMDARIDQVENGQVWTGFHRLEHDLFQTSDITYDGPVADELQADAAKVVAQVPRVDLSAEQVIAAARTLMQEAYEVQTTGREELYSHLDLADLAAGTEGAFSAYGFLRAITLADKPTLVTDTAIAFDELRDELAAFGSGADYTTFDALTGEERGLLRDRVEAVVLALARLTPVIARS